ncbi:MAG: phosphodiester glycosidase family protein [Clostridium sp.]|nr:phosphodiester glycosidase family protein [Clostridium sp.]
MKHSFSRSVRRAVSLALAAVFTLPTVYASAGTKKLATSVALTDDLTYINTITQHDSAGRVESFALELSPDSDITPIMLQSSGTMYAASTIAKAVDQAQRLGYHVLGAINTDYFSSSTGVPQGVSIENGVYKSSPEGNPAITVEAGELSYTSAPQVSITLTNRDSDEEIILTHFNKWRTSTGGLYLLNEDFSTVSTRTTDAGWVVRMELVKRDAGETLTVNSTLTLEVVETLATDQAVPIGEDTYILTASDTSNLSHVFEAFEVGDRVTLTTSCEDDILSDADWASGCGDLMIEDGNLTDSSDWLHINQGRAPRTALGVKEDGTILLYVADGRQSGYSGGLSQKDLALELQEQGCEWAVNLDGGGSSSMSVLLPGQPAPTLVNSPSDGKTRGCATYLLLVTEDQDTGHGDRLSLKEDGLVVLAGSSVKLGDAVVLDDSANTLSAAVNDLSFTSKSGLGRFDGAVYTAGLTAGTDVITLRSQEKGLTGTAQIHVVDALSELTVTKLGSTSALSSLNLDAGSSVSLTASGSYWSRPALRSAQGITWGVEGDIGTISDAGVFTASGAGNSGAITAAAGGITKRIPVSLNNVHNDVTKDHWAHTAVDYCYENNIVSGVSNTAFGRDLQIRRGDFMLMLYNAVGKPDVDRGCTFLDVSESDYYYTALAWAQQAGLASGTGGGNYAPKTNVTREQAFTILRQAMPLLGIDCPDGDESVLNAFADAHLIADYARTHTATLVSYGLVSGKGSGVDPRGNLTRAEMAVLLYGLMTFTYVPSEETEEPPAETPEDPTETPEELPNVTSITLDQTDITLRPGQSAALTAVTAPEDGSDFIVWSVSDPAAVAVSPDGLVTNLYAGTGTCAVTVTASCGETSASCLVRCAAAQGTGVVTGAELGLNVRSGPSTDAPIIASLNNEQQVIVLDAQEGWYRVLFLYGSQPITGYVSADYLTVP